jgi:hypothetical protein
VVQTEETVGDKDHLEKTVDSNPYESRDIANFSALIDHLQKGYLMYHLQLILHDVKNWQYHGDVVWLVYCTPDVTPARN